MRKKYLFPVTAALLLFSSCTKNNPTPNPVPPGGGGGGGNNTLTVTSIVPSNPYPDDEFTINGSGFNTNATLDTVEFGHLINGNFAAWHGGIPTEYASLCTVVSASATQLKIQSVNPFALDYNSFNFSPTSIAVAQVRTGSKKIVTPLIPFKRLMTLNGTNDPDANISWGRPGDSLDINGQGYNKIGLNASIGTSPLSNFKVDSTPNSARISLRLPKNFFGGENDETITQSRMLTVTNADGKSLQKNFTFFMSPHMYISGMQAEQSSYSLSGLNGSGGMIKIFIAGRNLKSDAVLHLDSNNGTHTQNNLQVSGFPDNLIVQLTPSAMAVGNYQVSIYRGNTLYGLCNFILIQ